VLVTTCGRLLLHRAYSPKTIRMRGSIFSPRRRCGIDVSCS